MQMGRKMQFAEKASISFEAGTMDRIANARREGEDTRAFIREAVEREIKRRLAARAKAS